MEFGKITALFGPNNSGKTSLLKLLLMLKQTVESRDRTLLNLGGDVQDLVNLGDYAETVYLHNTQNKIEVEIGWKKKFRVDEDTSKFLLQSHWRFANGLIEQEFLSLSEYDPKQQPNSLNIIFPASKDHLRIKIEGVDKTFNIPPIPISFAYNHILRRPFYIFPDADWSEERSLSKMIRMQSGRSETQFKLLFEKIYYLGPLRAQPQREYRWSGERASSIGLAGEYTIQSILSEIQNSKNLNIFEIDSQDTLTKVNLWLKRLGIADKLIIQQISTSSSLFEVRLYTDHSNEYANLADVGFGVSQVLPIVTLAYFAPPESIIILEQPELHLHPKVQAELADLFLEVAQTRNVQFIIESHSEHLLARLQRRLAERSGVNEHLTENDVRLYFCQRDGNESTLQPLQLDQYGQIQNWPPNFFGDLFDEQLKALEAMAQRKQKAQTNGQTPH